MSPVSLVFHTKETVKLISKMLLEQTHLFYNKIQTEVPDPYPTTNGGQK